MTTSEIDRLSRILTDMRVESAASFARIDERLNTVPNLVERVGVIEKQQAQTGRFGWAEVFKAAGAATAVVALYDTVIA